MARAAGTAGSDGGGVIALLARLRPRGLRLSDGFVLGSLVAFMVLLVQPLPSAMLDLFVALNLIIGVMLLLSAVYVVKPLDFSTFPSVLLFTTLFRVGLTIATTRAILTEAHAGQIVETFGQRVAGGQVLVGLVLFLALIIVQLLVVSKGAERVAEVGARFSLDAMPGKQLSIDSDLRSGLLSKDEARAKRRELELESKFHGSLDGAMKFVKGDTIFTICMVLINLIGGIAVGMTTFEMDMATAVSTFAVLTIGDGLVAQLPAFFAAIAAGMLVTRTTDADEDRDLGPAIARQMWSKPHVLMIGGIMSVALGMVPGFPTWVFLMLGLAMMGVGLARHDAAGAWLRGRARRARGTIEAAPTERVLPALPLRPVDPLLVTLTLAGPQADTAGADRVAGALSAAIAMLQSRSGIAVPAARIAFARNPAERAGGDPVAPDGTDRTEADAAPGVVWSVAIFDAPAGHGLIDGALDEPATVDAIAAAVSNTLSHQLGRFLGLQEVTDLLNWLGETHPEVVKETVRNVPTATIAEVLRMLADEGVPLRNLRDISEAIGEAGQVERSPALIAERTRVAIKGHVTAGIAGPDRLAVVMVSAALEDAIRATLTPANDQMRLGIDPVQMRALTDAIGRAAGQGGARAVLTAQDLRRPLRLVLAGGAHALPVLSFNELTPTLPLDVVGEVPLIPELGGPALPAPDAWTDASPPGSQAADLEPVA